MTTMHLGERTEELLCDRATSGLDPREEAELAELLAQGFGPDDGSLELAAAMVLLAEMSSSETRGAPLEPMPASLREAVIARAPHPASGLPSPSSAPVGRVLPLAPVARGRSRVAVVVPWLVAAACLALFVGAVIYRGLEPAVRLARPVPILPVPERTTLTDERAAFLRSTPDAVVIPFTATSDPAAQGTTGDVVFSPSTQRGFMRFSGLAPNDPRVSQYQLWIFDEERDERYPVDGGVFDMGPGGEVVVAIVPRVPVGKAKLFAVTIEKPGGVVVSKRERIVTTAALSG